MSKTSTSQPQDASGLCEYRVVYGGLELGLAIFFALAAFRSTLELPALWVALILHACLALYRAVIVASSSGLSSTIYVVFVLELALLLGAALLVLPRGLP